jgi:hypothetical protein
MRPIRQPFLNPTGDGNDKTGGSGHEIAWQQRCLRQMGRFPRMSETLLTYADAVRDSHGTYIARAVGRLADGGMWEGWIEFVPVDGGDVIITGVESRQPAREHLAYWATGLTPVYLEGALHRALTPITVRVRTEPVPFSKAPAPRPVAAAPSRAMSHPEPILDPFEIGARNLDVLRQELTALNRPRLLNIIDAYDLNPAREDISWMTDAQLVHFIVVAVDVQLPQRSRR